jgi:hypothetical protein
MKPQEATPAGRQQPCRFVVVTLAQQQFVSRRATMPGMVGLWRGRAFTSQFWKYFWIYIFRPACLLLAEREVHTIVVLSGCCVFSTTYSLILTHSLTRTLSRPLIHTVHTLTHSLQGEISGVVISFPTRPSRTLHSTILIVPLLREHNVHLFRLI